MTDSDPDPILSLRRSIRSCRACSLATECGGPVPPEVPNPVPRVMIVGEAPGRREDRAVAPFIGPAGQLARRWLHEAAPEAPEPVWANAVCCWPKGTPEAKHMLACRPNLLATFRLVQPTHVLAFGGVALDVLKPGARISLERGKWWRLNGEWGSAYAFSTWHPAAVLRDRNLAQQAEADVSEFMFYSLGHFAPQVDGGKPPWMGQKV